MLEKMNEKTPKKQSHIEPIIITSFLWINPYLGNLVNILLDR